MKYRNSSFNMFGTIDCEINHPVYGWIPFTCNPNDTGAVFDTAKLFELMKEDASTKKYTAPSIEEILKNLATQVRSERDYLLKTIVDPVVTNPLRWQELSEDKKQKYIDYRKHLLDITKQSNFPNSVVWPDKP